MKVNKKTMAEHRGQIVASAAKQFREHGFNGVSVADLMKEAGFTHGGFYGHFASKEELMALASERAVTETTAKWKEVIEQASEDPLVALAKSYLSPRHHDHPETGCLFAALGSDLARQTLSVRDVVTKSQQRMLDLLACIVPGRTKTERNRNAIIVLAGMVGGMILARSTSDRKLCRKILDTMAEAVPASVRH